jgi:hypothetical protein
LGINLEPKIKAKVLPFVQRQLTKYLVHLGTALRTQTKPRNWLFRERFEEFFRIVGINLRLAGDLCSSDMTNSG